eukprot:Gb_17346 [translate_table: standard]
MGVNDFELLTIIGKGEFGEVRLCRQKTTGHVYAMKKLKKSEILRRGQVENVKVERLYGGRCSVERDQWYINAESRQNVQFSNVFCGCTGISDQESSIPSFTN